MSMFWDPIPAYVQSAPCLLRVKSDLVAIHNDPAPGIHVVADEQDITLVHCLLVGPDKTPYEGGFFYFIVRFPPNYPIAPPKVKLMTTGGSKVRFNPNLYRDGKVCLSILGTWEGPGWSPAQSLTSVLISIQSLLNEKPYHNEPGYEHGHSDEVEQYNQLIQHETLRVAVVGMLDDDYSINLPQPLRQVMENYFVSNYETYTALIDSRIHLNGKTLNDPFRKEYQKQADYDRIKKRLQSIHSKLESKYADKKMDCDLDSSFTCSSESVMWSGN
ncbi:ubiquitin-conjugating enzyme E2 Z-like [Macrosteles quadrilineatus]|uniref:ubiquitin-conjugating enzyme E2 Z-like n=1 Tax=Macrosteles quadrilineatus TaxID=74068 RepID=UPI0023E33D45|nr:ubiquitin-conjugating enzyme E2 Z-like [Macrosteles quadrilineatus]